MTETDGEDATAELFERVVTMPEGYRRACQLLDLSVPPETLLGGSYAVAVAVWLVGVMALAVGSGALAVVVGIYVILLSVLLQPLSIGLRNGLDGPLIGFKIGKSLLVATPLYVITVFSVGVLI